MEFSKIKEIDKNGFMNVFNRQNICFTHGEKNKLYDTTGKEYTDFIAGIAVNSLGYNHPKLVEAISSQASKLIHISNLYYNEPQAQLVENLLDGTIFEKVFFANSGAEANEAAIKLVRKYYYNRGENKPVIITANNSFHGRTLATVTATGQEKYSLPYAPLPGGFKHVPFNDFEALRAAISEDVGAVMLECIQGESGVTPATYDYLVNAYALCKSKGILFVVDEVQTGVGRTGKMYAYEHYGILPDIITLAKGLAGGVPIGALLARGDVAHSFTPGDHGSTFGGNPLACAAANVVLNELKNGLLDEISVKGDYLNAKLSRLKKHKFVKDVRGMGLLQGLELSKDLLGAEVVGKMAGQGILINCAGNNTLRFAPPYTITTDEIDEMAEKLLNIFAATNI